MAQDFRNVVARAQGTTAAAILTGGTMTLLLAFVVQTFSLQQLRWIFMLLGLVQTIT